MTLVTARPSMQPVSLRSAPSASYVTHLRLAVNAAFAIHTSTGSNGRHTRRRHARQRVASRQVVVSRAEPATSALPTRGARAAVRHAGGARRNPAQWVPSVVVQQPRPAAPATSALRTRGAPAAVGHAGGARGNAAQWVPSVVVHPRPTVVAAAADGRFGGSSAAPAIGREMATHLARRFDRTEERTPGRRITRDRVDVTAEVARVLTTTDAVPEPSSAAQPLANQSALSTARGTQLAGIDLDGLTDRIVTRLDDRLTAHRERFGRAV
jgi:hypothetical protein